MTGATDREWSHGCQGGTDAEGEDTGADRRISRQIRERDAKDPVLIARDQRIKVARQEARRALRAWASADRAGRTADTAAGSAIALLDEGLSLSDAAVLLDVSRSAAKRLARLATGATGRLAAVSTELADDHAPRGACAHGETSGTTRGATKEGNP